MQKDIALAVDKLRRYIESENYKGYDPYDALISPLLKALSFNKKWIRIAFIQALKKSPLNFRPLLGLRKGLNPKGIGLILWSYAKLFKLQNSTDMTVINQMIDLLLELRAPGYSSPCWGYNFDWQSKAFFLPKNTPTVVNSSFIGHALLDTYQYTFNERALDLAISIKEFILNDLNKTEDKGTFCLSYSPLDKTIVHNANLLGSSLLIRIYEITGEEELRERALSHLDYTMKHQNQNGSWYYAETSYQKWIDSFHTGFNLQCIHYFLKSGNALHYKSQFEKGIKFYADNFFLKDGTPKYYHDRLYPIDIHSISQAVVFFSLTNSPSHNLHNQLACWMINNFMDDKGFFYFQKHRFYTNHIPYMRWSQAWAFHALTEYLLQENIKPSPLLKR